MLHTFDPEIAVQYGVDEAVFIQNLRFWLQYNEANEINCHEGKYWTFNSQRAYAELFPYWTEKQLRRIIDKLKDAGVIEVGCFNKSKYNRTTWYTLRADLLVKKVLPVESLDDAQKGNMHSPKRANGIVQKGETSYVTDVNSNVCTRAEALTNTETPSVSEKQNIKKSVITVADLVAEGVNPEHARDWIRARGKKALTPTAWARLKSDAQKHQVSLADAVKVCAENGWLGLNHDGAARVFADSNKKKDPKHWEPEDPNKICISPTGEKWFKGRRVI